MLQRGFKTELFKNSKYELKKKKINSVILNEDVPANHDKVNK